ncbi:MAG: helicase-exonuclease AddAB subunit AddA [Anaerotruncus sp.]|nr:helicase-exonuclease AddAB subunit AddA [Anaerotruncus sp.]
MTEHQWTPQQADAIRARGGTVLVSAAAGSGKTAVLVERVVGRILDKEQPVDADRLLVVTFSNAAALEMKQRIIARIGELLAAQPENEWLQRQQLLLGRAQISTIHSFCQELIRSNFQKLGIVSNIRVADEKELELLRLDCAGQVVEQFHQDGMDGAFTQLVELLSAGRDDRQVFATLFKLYDFLRAHPFYHSWLEHKLSFYDVDIPVEQSVWGKSILQYAADAVEHALELNGQALSIINADDAMTNAYFEGYMGDRVRLEQLLEAVCQGNWNRICQRLDTFVFVKLRALRGEDPKKDQVKALREGVKSIISGLRDNQFCATAAEFAEDIVCLKPLVAVLFELVKAFDRLFSETKQQRGIMDFSDMEHYAIGLLVSQAGAGYQKTELAEAISQQYDEILVDEFQDTNAAQEIIFRAVSRRENNLFMVGDVKQSIYRFRQAMPELFLHKKKVYAPFDGETFPAKIILGKNFRSAPEITGSINDWFRMLMSEKLGEITYDEEEALVAGGEFPQGNTAGCELALLDLSEYVGERDRNRVEADYVAQQIAGLLESGAFVSDKGVLRKITPGDICILMRSPSNKAQVYLDALTALSVPVWAEPKSSYLATREVAPVLALLRVVENPLLDIDLASAMMSALFGFSADEMAQVRIAARREPLYLAAQQLAVQGNQHCAEMLKTIAHLRRLAANATADQVIREIYECTDYLGKVQVMRMGQTRRANLLLLVQYACDYHASGYKGLAGFLGFLDRLIERGGDLAPASGLSERADVVRVMSIHRSKGLEFPVVFLCDCAKPFNKEDLRSNTLLHSELGFACVRRDLERMQQFTTVPMQALRLEIERSMLSEELRVLYVALTRAKERLYITGISMNANMTKNAPEKLAGMVKQVEADGRLSAYSVRGAGSYMDWLLMAAVHHPDLAPLMEELGIESKVVAAQAPLRFTLVPVIDDLQCEQVQEIAALAEPDAQLLTQLKRQMDFSYPYLAQTRIPTKMAVSQIAKGDLAKSYRFTRRPAFLQPGGLTAAQKGNALHKFMQFADYTKAAQNPKAEIERMAQEGFLTRPEADVVDARQLARFFGSPLAKRIFAAQRVYRELRFLAEVGAETLGEYTDLFDNEGKTAIQGVADCVFIEDGQAVIVDYKTDHVKTAQELVERYQIQLLLYRKVLRESLGVPIKGSVLYSFALSQEIAI